jgi:hypothetical protein
MYAREQMELERKLLDGIAKCNALIVKERDELKAQVAALTAERDRYRAALVWLKEMVIDFPTGIDYDADENDASPPDTIAWAGGLMLRRIDEALKQD